MSTNNILDVGLEGQNGTGSVVGFSSPTFVTPTFQEPTGYYMQFNPTTGGYVGDITGASAATGYVGNIVTSSILFASAITLGASGTGKTLVSISLSPGIWLYWGSVTVIAVSGVTYTQRAAGFGTSAGTLPDASLYSIISNSAIGSATLPVPMMAVQLLSTTVLYLNAVTTRSGGTGKMCGFASARRIA